jgi:mRNA interferase RelE/StbE
MGKYTITFNRKAEKFLASLPRETRNRISAAIDSLADNPRPPGCLKLREHKPEGWRIRVGKYRVLYQIHDRELLIWVFNVDLRDDAYSN